MSPHPLGRKHKTARRSLGRHLARLRKRFPVEHPVELAVGKVGRDCRATAVLWEDEDTGSEGIVITIAFDRADRQIEDLNHEWAHLLAWEHGGSDLHGTVWGIQMSRIESWFSGETA